MSGTLFLNENNIEPMILKDQIYTQKYTKTTQRS